MTDWVVVLTPFLVLPIVLLFRFVGCAQIAGLKDPDPDPAPAPAPAPAPTPTPSPPTPTPTPPPPPTETKPPNYRKYILGEQPNPGLVNTFPAVIPNGADVIAYWRLVDAPTATIADDEKDFQNGDYKTGHALPAVNPTPTVPGSEGRNPATFVPGQASLIDSDPGVQGRFFNGGYVLVALQAGAPLRAVHDRGLGARGPPGREFRAHAVRCRRELRLARRHPGRAAGAPDLRRPDWALAGPHGRRPGRRRAGRPVPGAAPGPLGARTHLAVTVAAATGTAKTVTLYVDGKLAATASLAKYDPPYDAPLYIGLENTQNDPTDTPTLRTPVLCRVQEVALHRKALSAQEIANHVDINRPS